MYYCCRKQIKEVIPPSKKKKTKKNSKISRRYGETCWWFGVLSFWQGSFGDADNLESKMCCARFRGVKQFYFYRIERKGIRCNDSQSHLWGK